MPPVLPAAAALSDLRWKPADSGVGWYANGRRGRYYIVQDVVNMDWRISFAAAEHGYRRIASGASLAVARMIADAFDAGLVELS